MIDPDQRARDLRRTLVAHGFKRDRSETAAYRYTGVLAAAGRKISVGITFGDLEFTRLPSVTLLHPEQEAPHIVAHLTAPGGLCFARNEDVVLDRYDVGGTALTCLELARRGLERALTHKHLEHEIAQEFPQHWFGIPIYYDIQGKTAGQARLHAIPRQKSTQCYLLTDSATALKRLGVPQSLERKLVDASLPAFVFRSAGTLTFPADLRPPETLVDFLEWLEAMIPGARARSLAEITATYPKAPAAIFVTAPNGCVGIVPKVPTNLSKAAQRQQGLYRILEASADKVKVQRYSGGRVDLDFIFKRNVMPHPPLLGKRIAVIGCGTIGGHLAKFLVHSGAGHGGGTLLILDNQRFEPANVGRHTLGTNSIGEYKVDGLKLELTRQFPDAHILPIRADAGKFLSNLRDYELVIDATGEEALSNSINHYFVQERGAGAAPDLLHVALYGNGAAAQALLVDGFQYACLKCLKPDHNGEHHYNPLKPGVSVHPTVAACGEGQYLAYGIAAPAMAAALVLHLVLDWNIGNPAPRMRTVRVEKKDTREIADKNAGRSERCPTCAAISR